MEFNEKNYIVIIILYSTNLKKEVEFHAHTYVGLLSWTAEVVNKQSRLKRQICLCLYFKSINYLIK